MRRAGLIEQLGCITTSATAAYGESARLRRANNVGNRNEVIKHANLVWKLGMRLPCSLFLTSGLRDRVGSSNRRHLQ